MGLKEPGLRGSLRNVSVGIDAIPDSVGNRFNAPEQLQTQGETVDPWDDLVGSANLTAIGSPTLNEGAVNNVDAIDLDGTDDAYRYDVNLSTDISAPCTIMWAVTIESLPDDDIVTLYRNSGDDTQTISQIIIRTDNDEFALNTREQTGGSGGDLSPSTGDFIFTLACGTDDAILRVNGTDDATAASADGMTVLESDGTGSFYTDHTRDDRFMDALAVETVYHPDDRLTGDNLTDEEERLESEANMSVLS